MGLVVYVGPYRKSQLFTLEFWLSSRKRSNFAIHYYTYQQNGVNVVQIKAYTTIIVSDISLHEVVLNLPVLKPQ